MFKKNYNGNELAAAELLGIDPTLSVVTKDSNGKNYVLTLIEDEEDETAPYQAVLFDPMYRFDGREHVTDQIEGMLEFEFTLMDDEKAMKSQPFTLQTDTFQQHLQEITS